MIIFLAASTYKWSLQAVQYTKKDKFDSIVKFLSARFYLKPVIEKGVFLIKSFLVDDLESAFSSHQFDILSHGMSIVPHP